MIDLAMPHLVAFLSHLRLHLAVTRKAYLWMECLRTEPQCPTKRVAYVAENHGVDFAPSLVRHIFVSLFLLSYIRLLESLFYSLMIKAGHALGTEIRPLSSG